MIKETAFTKKARNKIDTFNTQKGKIEGNIEQLHAEIESLEKQKGQYLMDNDPVEFQTVCKKIREAEDKIKDYEEYLNDSRGCSFSADEIITEWGKYLEEVRKPYDKLVKDFANLKKQFAAKYAEIRTMESAMRSDLWAFAEWSDDSARVRDFGNVPEFNLGSGSSISIIREFTNDDIVAVKEDFYNN